MKRLRNFEITVCDPKDRSKELDRKQFQSWHKSCHWVNEYFELHSRDCELEMIASDPKSGLTICEFSCRNKETEETIEQESMETPPGWESRVFHEVYGRTIYENRNIKELCWDLLDGAQRDVPFMLSLMERKSRSRGLLGSCIGTLQDIRNVFFS